MSTRQVKEQPVKAQGPARLELEAWKTAYGLVAGITTRADGFNLGFGTPDSAEKVSERWRTFLAAQRPQFNSAVLSHQVHGARVGVHTPPGAQGRLTVDGFDGHLTTAAGLLLVVTVADCVPVYLAHPKSGGVALLHAGWKGIAAGVVEEGIGQLASATLASPGDFVMHCGVSICGDCYEVGPEVVAAVSDTKAVGKTRLDLRAEIVQRAASLGVAAVTVSEHCAAHDGALFFSHRRSGGKDGRMVAYLGRPLA